MFSWLRRKPKLSKEERQRKDMAEFKALCVAAHAEAMGMAKQLVDAGLATWKRGFDPRYPN
jgi:hypothetical protein